MKQEKKEKQEVLQEKQEEIKPNKEISWSEAESEIYRLIQTRMRYNEITKIGFNIQGKGFHRFSISEISRIKKQFNENKQEDNPINTNKNDEISVIFNLIKQGYSAIEIVIRTKKDPEFIQTCFNQYRRLQGYSQSFVEDIFSIFHSYGFECKTEDNLLGKLAETLEAYDFLNEVKYRCSVCRDYVYLNPFRDRKHTDDCIEDWQTAINHLSKHNCHHYCS